MTNLHGDSQYYNFLLGYLYCTIHNIIVSLILSSDFIFHQNTQQANVSPVFFLHSSIFKRSGASVIIGTIVTSTVIGWPTMLSKCFCRRVGSNPVFAKDILA